MTSFSIELKNQNLSPSMPQKKPPRSGSLEHDSARVIEGLDNVDKVQEGDVMVSVTIER